MAVECEHAGDLTILRVEGDLSGLNAEDLRVLAAKCIKEGHRDFLIDLASVNACDSAGLESLTWLHQRCVEALGLVKLCALSDTMQKVLELTRLKDRFEHDTF